MLSSCILYFTTTTADC